ncbi:hypothetical protein [Propionibacterium sp. oral taxon 192]|nr:hypothetical protein [Propionibacterium sp. oral taxon 192]
MGEATLRAQANALDTGMREPRCSLLPERPDHTRGQTSDVVLGQFVI